MASAPGRPASLPAALSAWDHLLRGETGAQGVHDIGVSFHGTEEGGSLAGLISHLHRQLSSSEAVEQLHGQRWGVCALK